MWKWIWETSLRKRKKTGVASINLEYEYGRGYVLLGRRNGYESGHNILEYENRYGK